MAVALVSDATLKRLLDRQAGYSERQTERATAAGRGPAHTAEPRLTP